MGPTPKAPAAASPSKRATTESPSNSKNEGTPGKKRPRAAGKAKVVQQKEVPLVVPAGVCRGKQAKASLLLQLEDERVDLSKDSGAIGRLTVDSHGLKLDLKGNQYDGVILPNATMMVMNVGASEAKVEALFSDHASLHFTSDVMATLGGEVLRGETGAVPKGGQGGAVGGGGSSSGDEGGEGTGGAGAGGGKAKGKGKEGVKKGKGKKKDVRKGGKKKPAIGAAKGGKPASAAKDK